MRNSHRPARMICIRTRGVLISRVFVAIRTDNPKAVFSCYTLRILSIELK